MRATSRTSRSTRCTHASARCSSTTRTGARWTCSSDRSGCATNGAQTVPLAELLLTKLQIIEVNEKDVRDTVLLLYGHDVGEHDDDTVNAARVAELCAADWGLWRTITANLERCREHVDNYELGPEAQQRVSGRFDKLLARIEDEPKSRGWKLRAKVGERKRWYELPEEVSQ